MTAAVVREVGCGVPLDAAPDPRTLTYAALKAAGLDPERLEDRRTHLTVAVDVERVISARRRDDWQDYINQHRKAQQ